MYISQGVSWMFCPTYILKIENKVFEPLFPAFSPPPSPQIYNHGNYARSCACSQRRHIQPSTPCTVGPPTCSIAATSSPASRSGFHREKSQALLPARSCQATAHPASNCFPESRDHLYNFAFSQVSRSFPITICGGVYKSGRRAGKKG